MSNCDCGGPCFYCDRALSRHRHDHDHFPIPWRHGGDVTVPACRECHSLKDRCGMVGFHRDGTPDPPVLAAIWKGVEPLPPAIDASTGASVPVAMFVLWEWYCDVCDAGAVGWDGVYDALDWIETLGQHVAWSIPQCTTPEARIWLAQAFNLCLDRLDDAIRQGGSW
jgi:hypothetical protein